MAAFLYKICYQIGRFKLGLFFNNRFCYQGILDVIDDRFKIDSESKVDCRCYFLNRDDKVEISSTDKYLKKVKMSIVYSDSLRQIKVVLHVSRRVLVCRVKGNLYFLYFAPFLLKHHALFLHCSAVIYGRHAFAFVGESGAGKSTIARILSKGGAKIITEEMALIDCSRGACYISPVWSFSKTQNKFSQFNLEPVPLKALFFLKKGKFSLYPLNYYAIIKNVKINSFSFCIPELAMQEDFLWTIMRIYSNTKSYMLNYDRSKKIFTLLNSFCR